MAPRISVLGTTEIEGEPEAASLTRRDRIVLGALTASHGEPLTVDQLSDALWGDQPPKSSAKVVQGAVVRLRRVLGNDAIETSGAGYRLTLDGDTVDCRVFERLVARARELAAMPDPERAAAAYEQALTLWRGAPLPELQEWDPGRAEAERLLEVRRSVEEELVEARMDCGLVAAAVADAQHLVRREPYREHRWALLALALYRTGRQREALDAIRRARTTLLDELGLDPGPELVDLEQGILQQDPILLEIPEAPIAASTTCPWPGLRPFDSDHAEMYAGREGDVDTCVARLGAYPLLVVVGASGSGKSSLVRAGLAPRLMDDGATVIVIAPGATPVATLTTALSSIPDESVLVVDQLEELFASTSPDAVATFLDRLADQVGAGHRVVATLRADYLASLAGSSAFAREAERGLLLLAPMDEAQLREAIEEPAKRSGLRLEPGLVDLLLRDVGNDAGGLPLLSHALAETWTRRDGSVLTVEGYRATGGINGAVAQSAERLYESLSTDDRDGLRSVLQRLVTPTPAGDPVAARVPTKVFDGTDDAPRLLDLLVRARLVTASADTATLAHESLVRAWPRLSTWLDEDVEGQRVFAHLQVAADGWEAGGRPDDELYRGARLETALEWRDRTHPVLAESEVAFLDASAAYADSEDRRRAAELATQKTRNRQLRGALAGVVGLLVLALVAGSLAVVRGRQAEDSAATATASANAADAARLSALGLALPEADTGLLLARQAVSLSDTPQSRGTLLATLARESGLMGSHPTGHGGFGFTYDDQVSADGSRAFITTSAAATKDLPWGYTSTYLIDPRTGAAVGQAPLVPATPGSALDPDVNGMGFIDHDRVVVSARARNGGAGPGVELVYHRASDGTPIGKAQPLPGSASPGYFDRDWPRISSDGKTIVSVLNRTVRIWHRAGSIWTGPASVPLPKLPASIAGQDIPVNVRFSADGSRASLRLVLQGPPFWRGPTVAIVVDTRTLRFVSPLYTPEVAGGGPKGLDLSPDGRLLAESHVDGSVLIHDLSRPLGAPVRIPGPAAGPLRFSPDGRRLAVGDERGNIAVYRLDPLELMATFSGFGLGVNTVTMPDSGRTVVSLDELDAISTWSVQGSTPTERIVETGRTHAISAGPPGTVVAIGKDDGHVELFDQRTMTQRRNLWLGPYPVPDGTDAPAGHRRVSALAVSADGAVVAAGDRTGHLRMWSVSDGHLLWSRDDVPTSWLDLSPDGRWLATSGFTTDPKDPNARHPDWIPATTTFTIWDLTTHKAVLVDNFLADSDHGSTPKPRAVAFSPDSSMVAAQFNSVNQQTDIYDLATLKRRALPDVDDPTAIAFSPDSKQLVIRAALPGTVTAFDSRTGDLLGSYTNVERGYGHIAFSTDGRWLVGGSGKVIDVWDARSRHLVVSALPMPADGTNDAVALAPTADGMLFIGTQSALVRLDLNQDHWSEDACTLAGRTLTKDEWAQYLPDRPYDPACAT